MSQATCNGARVAVKKILTSLNEKSTSKIYREALIMTSL